MADRLAIRPGYAACLVLLTLGLSACGTLGNNQAGQEYAHIPTAGEVRGAEPTPAGQRRGSWFDSWWPFGEDDPIRPAAFTIEQYTLANPAAKEPERQNVRKLEMSLLDGRTTYTDTEGAAYPLQVEESTYRQIRQLLTEEEWQQETMKLPKHVIPEQLTFYDITVRQIDDAPPVTTRWYVPREEPVPNALKTITDTWLHLHRQVHPISNRVDLLGRPKDATGANPRVAE